MNKLVSTGLLLVFVSLLALFFWLNSGYGEISKNAYDLAIASYGACLSESQTRIAKVESLLADPDFTIDMSDQEQKWFRDLIAKTKSDQWQKAANIAKRMMEDQVQH